MTIPVLPTPVEITPQNKKAIIDGLKKVLSRLQQMGFIGAQLTYHDLIVSPTHLAQFIHTFVQNRESCDDLVISKDNGPVRDDDLPLLCGTSLNQIQQLLIRTCAKKVFEPEKTVETVTETVVKKSLFGLIKRTEQVEVTRPTTDPIEERKFRELNRYLAFDWQLPLLESFRDHLSYQQIVEIGGDLLALSTPEAVIAVGQFDPQTVRKVKQTVGDEFVDVLLAQPQAIAGIAAWNRDMYDFYRKLLEDKAWAFFARETAFFNVVASLDKPIARLFGDVLCYIAADNLEEIQRLNIDKIEVLVTSLQSAFGNKLPQILSVPAFSKEILRKVVDNLLHMNQEKEKLSVSFALTCKAMVPTVMDWLGKYQASNPR